MLSRRMAWLALGEQLTRRQNARPAGAPAALTESDHVFMCSTLLNLKVKLGIDNKLYE